MRVNDCESRCPRCYLNLKHLLTRRNLLLFYTILNLYLRNPKYGCARVATGMNSYLHACMYMTPVTTDKVKLPFFAAFHHLDFLGSRHSFCTLFICDRKDCQSLTMVTEHWKASVNGREGLQKTNPV